MRIHLLPGETLYVVIEGSLHTFMIESQEQDVVVSTNKPDDESRIGVIYKSTKGARVEGGKVKSKRPAVEEEIILGRKPKTTVVGPRELKVADCIEGRDKFSKKSSSTFHKLLDGVETMARLSTSRGKEGCTLCPLPNPRKKNELLTIGSGSVYVLDNWVWPETLSHYVLFHGSRPPEDFIAFITEKAKLVFKGDKQLLG